MIEWFQRIVTAAESFIPNSRKRGVEDMTIDEVIAMDEKQVFDRKSIRIKPVDLSDIICVSASTE